MREIKFRAWDTKKKLLLPVESMAFTYGGWNNWIALATKQHSTYGLSKPDDEWELMQFTGLYDKNGKEIYEGDLIKVNINVCVSGHAYTGDDEWIDVDYYAVVKFMPSKGFYGKVLRATNNIDDTEPRATKMVTIASYRTEVIGNIYSNPELAGRTE